MGLTPTDSESRWPMRLAFVMLGGGALALAFVLTGTGNETLREDRYVVLDVIGGGDGGRHAVVDRFTRAGDAVSVVGVWVAQGAMPEKGSRRAPEGRPVAVWRSDFPRLAWQGDRLRLIGTYDRLRREDVAGCLNDRTPSWDLCIDPARVSFAPLPR